MGLNEIKSGSVVFIDTNIFIYHFTGMSDECSTFLMRCENGDITGTTSVIVFLELLHRLMISEAVQKGLVKSTNIVKKLGESPDIVKQLSNYYIYAQEIADIGVVAKPVSADMIKASQIFRSRYGLMVNDSINVAVMREEGIKAIATNDYAFTRIESISAYVPSDVRI